MSMIADKLAVSNEDVTQAILAAQPVSSLTVREDEDDAGEQWDIPADSFEESLPERISLEQAISELDSTMVTNKQRIKKIEYNDKKSPGRPSKEITVDKEELVAVKTMIDRKGLLNVSASLKNIKDIMAFTGDDIDEEDTDAYFEKAGLLDEENTET